MFASASLVRTSVVTTLLFLSACATRAGMDQPMQGQQVGTVSVEAVQQTFDDENVAAVLTALNLMEIEPSRLALERSRNRAVQDYARRMINEHGAVQEAMQEWLSARGMVPRHNAHSVALTRNLEPTLADLRAQRGAAFDDAYLHQQLAAHAEGLHTLDTTLIPAITDPDLRNFVVTQVRPAIADHLARVKQIHEMLTSHQT